MKLNTFIKGNLPLIGIGVGVTAAVIGYRLWKKYKEEMENAEDEVDEEEGEEPDVWEEAVEAAEPKKDAKVPKTEDADQEDEEEDEEEEDEDDGEDDDDEDDENDTGFTEGQLALIALDDVIKQLAEIGDITDGSAYRMRQNIHHLTIALECDERWEAEDQARRMENRLNNWRDNISEDVFRKIDGMWALIIDEINDIPMPHFKENGLTQKIKIPKEVREALPE